MQDDTKGFQGVKDQVELVRKRKLIYTIFTIEPINPIEFKVLDSCKNNYQSTAKDIIKQEDLERTFMECSKLLKENQGYFIVYDFGFFGTDGEFRSMLCLISLIPDSLAVNKKFTFSSCSLTLADNLMVAKNVLIKSLSEFSYQEVKEKCMAHKKN